MTQSVQQRLTEFAHGIGLRGQIAKIKANWVYTCQNGEKFPLATNEKDAKTALDRLESHFYGLAEAEMDRQAEQRREDYASAQYESRYGCD